MTRVMRRAVPALMIAFALTTTATAAPTAEDTIKYRNAVMEEMAAHMSALTLILFDKVDGAQFTQGHVDALARAGTEIGNLFPEVSKDGDTDALSLIWDNPEKFAEAVGKASSALADFQAAAASGDRGATLGAFAEAGKACKACHEIYRAEEHDDHDH